VLEESNGHCIPTAVFPQLLERFAMRSKGACMLNLAKPPRIVHPYFFDCVASNPWQDLRGRARFPQGLLGGQIVGRNECLQIPERLLQDALGAYQLLLMVKDIMLQRGHGSAGLALDRTSGSPSPTARLRAFFKPEFVPKPSWN
jgi:hypothetical protein